MDLIRPKIFIYFEEYLKIIKQKFNNISIYYDFHASVPRLFRIDRAKAFILSLLTQ